MNNTISSCLLVVGIMFVMVCGLLALISRVPILKKHILGEA